MANRMVLALLLAAASFVTATAQAQEPALAALKTAARAHPHDSQALAAYGHALLRAGRYREARQTLRTVARLEHQSPEALYDIARVAFAQHDYHAARSACRVLDHRAHDSALSHVCNARAFLVWNRSERAVAEVTAAQQIAPHDFEALLALGDAHRLRAEVAPAEAAYQQAAQVKPNSAEPWLGLGRLYAAADRHDDALRAYRHARQLDNASPTIAFELGRLVGGAEGKQLLQEAVAGRPSWAEAQVALGNALLGTHDATGAEAAFRTAMHLDAHLATAQAGLGRALMAEGKNDDAEKALKKALTMVANSPETVLALAQLYAQTGRHEDAFEQYRHAADLAPEDPTPLLRAAKLALSLHRDVLASGFLDRLLNQHPNVAAGLALYGDIMRMRHERAQAQSYYQRALHGTGDFDRAHVQGELQALSHGGVAPHPQRGRL